MAGRGPKGLWPAVTDIERIASPRLRLYEHYDRDDELAQELMRFHGDWWDELGPALRRLFDSLPDLGGAEQLLADAIGKGAGRGYLAALAAVAGGAGLDRIPMVGTPPVVQAGYLPSGIAQVHRFLWHLDKALLGERARVGFRGLPPLPRPTFVQLASFGTPIPAVDTSIAGTSDLWDPRTELLADARRRLRDETGLAPEMIEAELNRIADEGGYEFPDTSTVRRGISRLERNAQWVWWRIRRRWTYRQIAHEWERLHPGDIRLQARARDEVARQWEAQNPLEVGTVTASEEAVTQVRRAVSIFAGRARVNVKTAPGRRAGRG